MIIIELHNYNLQEAKFKICQHLINSEIGITVSKTAELLGTDSRTIYRWQEDGKITLPEKRGKKTFDENDAIKLLQNKGYKIEKL